MKKTNHHRAWTGLMACLLAVTAWMFYGGKNEMKEMGLPPWVDPEEQYVEENGTGYLYLDEKTQSWIIISDSVLKIPHINKERGIIFEIKNLDKEFHNFINKHVLFSGKFTIGNYLPEKFKHYSAIVGDSAILNLLEVEEMSLLSSRSINIDADYITECGTKPTPRKHIDNSN